MISGVSRMLTHLAATTEPAVGVGQRIGGRARRNAGSIILAIDIEEAAFNERCGNNRSR